MKKYENDNNVEVKDQLGTNLVRCDPHQIKYIKEESWKIIAGTLKQNGKATFHPYFSNKFVFDD